MAAPILKEIVRQHVEMAAFLWTVYNHHLLHPDENPDMDEERLMRLVERIDAHLDGVRVAADMGRRIARERYEEYPEEGELFVVRMSMDQARHLQVTDLDLEKVRTYLAASVNVSSKSPPAS